MSEDVRSTAEEPQSLKEARLAGQLSECDTCGEPVNLERHIVEVGGRKFARCYDCADGESARQSGLGAFA